MLISCPTCPAEYEVDAADIGPEGRVVECSSCGARWHQTAPAPDVDEGETASLPGLAEAKASLAAFREEETAAPDVAGSYESLYGDDDDEDPPAAEKPAAPERRSAEIAQLHVAPPVPPVAPEPETKSLEEQAPGLAAALRDPRKGRALPDAARLNAELRASADEEERLDRQTQSGFRTGLYMIVLIGLLAIGAYHGRAMIVQKLPPVAPYVNAYADAVDNLHAKIIRSIAGAVQTAAPPPTAAPTEPPAEETPTAPAPETDSTVTPPSSTPGGAEERPALQQGAAPEAPAGAAPTETAAAVPSAGATASAARPSIGAPGGSGPTAMPGGDDDEGMRSLGSLGGGPRPMSPGAPTSAAPPRSAALPSLGAPAAPPPPPSTN